MQEKISGSSSGRSMRLLKKVSRQADRKKGEWQRTSSWAAKRRSSRPMAMVTIELHCGMRSMNEKNSDIRPVSKNSPAECWTGLIGLWG